MTKQRYHMRPPLTRWWIPIPEWLAEFLIANGAKLIEERRK